MNIFEDSRHAPELEMLTEVLSTFSPEQVAANLRSRSDHVVCAVETVATRRASEILRTFGNVVDANRNRIIRQLKLLCCRCYEKDPRFIHTPEKQHVDTWNRTAEIAQRELLQRMGKINFEQPAQRSSWLPTLILKHSVEEIESLVATLPDPDFQETWKSASDSCSAILQRMPEEARVSKEYPPAILKLEQIITACATVRTRRQREEEKL